MSDAKLMAKAAVEALEDKKGSNIKIIEIGDISPVADYFIISDGSNTSQVEAMVDSVKEKLYRMGYEPRRVEGTRDSGWVLMDYNDIVVHVFSSNDRLFYDLERVWKDGKTVSFDEL